MPRPVSVPDALRDRPFSVAKAAALGLTKHHLESLEWERLGGGRYAHRSVADVPLVRFEAALSRLPQEAALSGHSAALMYGLDLGGRNTVEITIPKDAGVSARAGITLRRSSLSPPEVNLLRGLRVTTPVRTLADVARSSSLVEAVVALDAGLHEGLSDADSLAQWTAEHARHRGIRRLRRALLLAEPATESPMETRLRVLLMTRGRLPKPLAQVSLYDSDGGFLGRPDLYYPDQRLCIEYDGAVHRDSLNEDDRRQNRLIDAGYRLLRFTAPDLTATPEATIALVRAALNQRVPAIPPFKRAG